MFTSYAQNFEDVILWRALRHIENGFYIDVGAQDPVVESVSRAFYENGWRGIHAEATSYYANKVRKDRPDEVVVQAAIGFGKGNIRFFEISGTGLSTSDPSFAVKHQADGHRMIETEAPLMPLSTLFEMAGERDIHWLKVDVEGMEASVIESWGPSTAKPWIVVMESTLPNSRETNFDSWEGNLLSRGYKYVYFDGLSRFYVSEEHPELIQYFGPGPNVFDGFTLAEQTPYTAVLRISHAEREQKMLQTINVRDQQLEEGRRQRSALEEALRESRQSDAAAHQLLQQTYRSLSWRLTRPLREINVLLFRMLALPRRFLKALIEHLIRRLSKNQEWKNRCLWLLHRFPRIRNRLERFAYARGYGGAPTQMDSDEEGQWHIDAPKGASVKWNVLIKDISNTK